MTVKNETSKGEWICAWFVGTKYENGSFKASELTDEMPVVTAAAGKPRGWDL